MKRIIISLMAIGLLLLFESALADKPIKGVEGASEQAVKKAAVLWRQPSDIKTRNLLYGPGGQAGQPRAPFQFIEEDRDASSPKFIVQDARGVRWKVKLGEEARPETAASHLLWAVGYFADVDYFLPRMRVAGLPKLRRGQQYVTADGWVQGARLERAAKKADGWSWFDNPFIGTREFDGLRVMMALINKWDLKKINNAVYETEGGERLYAVSDLGDTFGKTGSSWTRSKGNLEDYLESEFIDEVKPEAVDLVLNSRPPVLYAFAIPYYIERTRMEKVAEDIPRAHARWIGQWLARLSDRQLSDAFRAAGYAPREASAYAAKVRERISQLERL
ncbi:MAG TPA: hypothetical protein VJZ91_07375 [Blastocatellia bacterium]|nr:hypothetical protein [Blastocatellia bacterium]